jgi:hypothetical protein
MITTEEEKSLFVQEFENWCHTLDCIELWKERKRRHALATALSNCSQTMLVAEGLLEPQNQTSAVDLETTASQQ